jgi:hypothetical protein
MKQYMIAAMQKANRKSFLSGKLFSIACLLLLLNPESYFDNLKFELSFSNVLPIVILYLAIYIFFKYKLRKQTDDLTESKKSNQL